MLVKYDSRVINKLETLLTDVTRVIIYNCHMFIVEATGCLAINMSYQNKICSQTFQHRKSIGFGNSCHLIKQFKGLKKFISDFVIRIFQEPHYSVEVVAFVQLAFN